MADLDEKMPRGIEAESVTEITESILAPMAGERICGRTECNESGKRADGANCDRVTIAAELCERKANPRQESSSLRTVVSIRNAGAGEIAAKQLGSQAAKFLKDVRAIRRKDDKSETEAISRHSERLAKNLRNIVIRFFGLKLLLSSE